MPTVSRRTLLLAAVMLGGGIAVAAILAQGRGSSPAQKQSGVTPFSACSADIDIASLLPGGAHVDPDVVAANTFIDTTESDLIREIESAADLDQYRQMTLLGKVTIFDKTLSPAKNLACESCHVHYVGFTGASSVLNATIVAQPGSANVTNAVSPAPNFRLSGRKPQSYAYAAFAPILHYNETQRDLYGGNFWDMRATGVRLTNPAAEQAQGPPVNPLEMANSDTACVVWKISQRPYRSLVETIWGQSLAINWPANIETICAKPGPAPQDDLFPVHLSERDRAVSNSTYDRIALAMASYEASPDVSPFSSKFDAWLAGHNVVLSAEEKRGYDLFNGKAHCNQCHLSGIAVNTADAQAADVGPLFTDFTSANLGLPRNLAQPYYCESKPDQFGYVANPQGTEYKDLGVGGMLVGPNNPNAQWRQFASGFNGKFQTPTLRDVDMRPRPGFVKAYMHNGYLKSLKEVVHFYNTSKTLPRCAEGSPGEKVTCWPEPEVTENITSKIGNLGLANQEEDDIVSFLKTLTDGFPTIPAKNTSR